MSRQMEVPLRLRSPLWIGGLRGAYPKVSETGVIGSLRFWYGGYCRRIGTAVCDGTGDDCKCAVCELFGRTGLARRFSLRIEGLRPLGGTRAADQARWRETAFDPRLWKRLSPWAFVPEKQDQISLYLIAREGAPPETLDMVAGLLDLISRIGGLGAKTQYGCGQFEVSDVKELDVTRDVGLIDREFTLSASRFYSLRYSVSDQTMEAFELRLKLRRALRTELDVDMEADTVLGTLKYKDGQARSSRVHISNLAPSSTAAKRREFKVWFDDSYPSEIQTMVEAALTGMETDWKLDWSWL